MTPVIDTAHQQLDTITPVCTLDGGAWHLEAFTDDGKAFIDLQTPETMSTTTAAELHAALGSAIARATRSTGQPPAVSAHDSPARRAPSAVGTPSDHQPHH